MDSIVAITEKTSVDEELSRDRIAEVLGQAGGKPTAGSVNYNLSKLLNSGTIIRVGRNAYRRTEGKKPYSFKHSEEACAIADEISKAHPYLDFRVFELIQLNEFVNHQIAHNMIFVFSENETEEYVFDTLWENHKGNVLLKPKADDMFRYRSDDMIIVGRLLSESPKSKGVLWDTRIEKILVDIVADRFVSKAVYNGEVSNIYAEVFAKYVVDMSTLKRYASRKGAWDRIQSVMNEAGIDWRI